MTTAKEKLSKNETSSGPSTLQRVAVVAALRTPFVKAFGAFENETALSLSTRVTLELVNRSGINAADVGELIWGTVIPQLRNPNIARDIVLFSGLPKTIPGFTLNRACASGLQAIQSGYDAIRLGRVNLVIAGGVEVMSDVPIAYSDEARKFLTKLSRTRSLPEKLSLFKKFNPASFLPKPPSLTEPFTGLTMGEHAEVMALQNNITRARQDAYTVASHQKAAQAWENGFLDEEVIPFWQGNEKSSVVNKDNIIRPDISLDVISTLKPVFDKKNGTITAANSSALTDGASGVILAAEKYAKENGLPILGYVVDSESVAVDPADQLLIAPAIAMPRLLQRNNLKVGEISIFEIHEAFAAQTLSCLDALKNADFAKKHNLPFVFGELPNETLNIDGGSLAYGHPFAATGGRLVARALNILSRKSQRYALLSVCAAGAMGQAMLLEQTDN